LDKSDSSFLGNVGESSNGHFPLGALLHRWRRDFCQLRSDTSRLAFQDEKYGPACDQDCQQGKDRAADSSADYRVVSVD